MLGLLQKVKNWLVSELFALFSKLLCARYTNQKEHGPKPFKLVEVEDGGFSFEHKPFFGPDEKVKVPLEELKGWKKYKGQAPEKCDATRAEALMVHNSAALAEELHKAKVQTALLEACKENAPAKGVLVFTHGPSGLWCGKNVKKGELKLFPAGTVSRIKDNKTKGKVVATFAGGSFAISGMKAAADFGEDKGVLDAYYWVKSTPTSEDANMIAGSVTSDKVLLPFLTNSKAVKAGEQLLFAKEQNDDPATDTATSAPAAKKVRR